VGSGQEAHGKQNLRGYYAAGLRIEPAMLVRGSSRRITFHIRTRAAAKVSTMLYSPPGEI
jgi:hypothetical protein